MNFEGKVAVVTGAAAGIGRGTAVAFAKHQASVALLDIDLAGVEETARLVEEMGGRALPVRADVAVESEVAAAFEQIGTSLERIDILVNNAGVELYRDFLDYTSSEWDRLLAVNLNSVFHCSKQAIPFMIRSGEGSIVNISSVQALATTGQVSPYAAAKGGILSLTRNMARELGRHRIRINSVCPGCIDTPMMDRTLETMPDAAAVVKKMSQAIPLQRLGKPRDIAHAVLFLASSYADYVSGTLLTVDGGLMSKLPLPEYW
ncbi:MAG: SDR family NAD(P)-dependent oxidoreductase [Acidobacteriota bacterium]